MNRPARRTWRTVLTLFAVVVGAVLGPGVAQAAPLEGAAVLREAAVFANLDSLSPPIVTTLEPGRDVAYPACRRYGTNMVFIRWAPREPSPARRTSAGPTPMRWTCTPRRRPADPPHTRRAAPERDEDSGGHERGTLRRRAARPLSLIGRRQPPPSARREPAACDEPRWIALGEPSRNGVAAPRQQLPSTATAVRVHPKRTTPIMLLPESPPTGHSRAWAWFWTRSTPARRPAATPPAAAEDRA